MESMNVESSTHEVVMVWPESSEAFCWTTLSRPWELQVQIGPG